TQPELAILEGILETSHTFAITDDRLGIEYVTEKTYQMVDVVNTILDEGRRRIPSFDLTGELLADTEFPPHTWLVTISEDIARHQPISDEEFLRRRRKLYPFGYRGYGMRDRPVISRVRSWLGRQP